jgi:hypothetical protein
MHKLDTPLELLRFAPEGRSCWCLVLGNPNGGKHGAVHSLEGREIAAGMDHRRVNIDDVSRSSMAISVLLLDIHLAILSTS